MSFIAKVIYNLYIWDPEPFTRICEFCGSEFTVKRRRNKQGKYEYSKTLYCDRLCKNSHIKEIKEDIEYLILSEQEIRELNEKIYRAKNNK